MAAWLWQPGYWFSLELMLSFTPCFSWVIEFGLD